MNRHKRLSRKTALRRGRHPVRRKSPLPRSNPRRRARLRKQQYGDHATWIRKHVCPICGAHPVHAHHTKGRLVESLTPLCWKHHRLYHDIGRDSFKRETGVDLDALARELWEISPANVPEGGKVTAASPVGIIEMMESTDHPGTK